MDLQKEAVAKMAQMPPRSGGTLPVVFHSSTARGVPLRESRRQEEQQVIMSTKTTSGSGSRAYQMRVLFATKNKVLPHRGGGGGRRVKPALLTVPPVRY